MKKADLITLAGPFFALTGSFLMFSGFIPAAALFYVLSFVCDALDGWTARKEGTTQKGAFLDAFSDRIADVAMVAPFIFVLDPPFSFLPFVLMASVFLPAYIRALSVYCGYPLEKAKAWKGIGGRQVRAGFISAAAISLSFDHSFVYASLLLALIFTWITIVRRFLETWSSLQG